MCAGVRGASRRVWTGCGWAWRITGPGPRSASLLECVCRTGVSAECRGSMCGGAQTRTSGTLRACASTCARVRGVGPARRTGSRRCPAQSPVVAVGDGRSGVWGPVTRARKGAGGVGSGPGVGEGEEEGGGGGNSPFRCFDPRNYTHTQTHTHQTTRTLHTQRTHTY